MGEKIITTRQRLAQMRETMTVTQIVNATGMRRHQVLRILDVPMKQIAPVKRKDKSNE